MQGAHSAYRPDMTETILRMQKMPAFPGYSITDDGRIWGPGRNRVSPGWMTPRLSKKGGYPTVKLSVAGKKYTRKVHRLVALTFLGPPPVGKPWALHRNGIPSDCRVENLYWGSQAENVADRERHGVTARGATHGRSVLTAENVREIRHVYGLGSESHRSLGERFRVSASTVRGVLTGRCWSHVA